MNSDAKPHKPKRRWLRFSLRTFLVLVTIFLIWLGWFVNRVRQQQEVVAWVTRNGGEVTYDFEYGWNGTGPRPTQPNIPAWLLRILGVDYFSSVAGVNLGQARINDFTPLIGLPNLKSLQLWKPQIRDLTLIAEFSKLERLTLLNTQLDNLTPLTSLSDLKYLSITRSQINDLTSIAELTELEILDLSGTSIIDLTPLATLNNLEILCLGYAKNTDVTPLTDLVKLKYIWLDWNRQIKNEQIERWQEALPNCKISRDLNF